MEWATTLLKLRNKQMNESSALEVANAQKMTMLELYRRAVAVDRLFTRAEGTDKSVVFTSITYMDKLNSFLQSEVHTINSLQLTTLMAYEVTAESHDCVYDSSLGETEKFIHTNYSNDIINSKMEALNICKALYKNPPIFVDSFETIFKLLANSMDQYLEDQEGKTKMNAFLIHLQ